MTDNSDVSRLGKGCRRFGIQRLADFIRDASGEDKGNCAQGPPGIISRAEISIWAALTFSHRRPPDRFGNQSGIFCQKLCNSLNSGCCALSVIVTWVSQAIGSLWFGWPPAPGDGPIQRMRL
jgi:hypothetical protein